MEAPPQSASGSRQLVGTLLVAWTFVTGCALVLATALYQRSGDLKVLIAWLGAPFVVGTALMLMLLVTTLATRTKTEAHVEMPTGIRRRNDIHGRR